MEEKLIKFLEKIVNMSQDDYYNLYKIEEKRYDDNNEDDNYLQKEARNLLNKIMTKEQKERMSELYNTVYSIEEQLDGEYSIGMFGNKFSEIDILHKQTLDILRKYNEVLGKLIK